MIGYKIQPETWYFANIEGVGNCFFRVLHEVSDDTEALCIRDLCVPNVRQVAPGTVNVTVQKWGGYEMRLAVDPLHIPVDAVRCLARPAKETIDALDGLFQTVRPATPDETNRLRHIQGRNGS